LIFEVCIATSINVLERKVQSAFSVCEDAMNSSIESGNT